MLPDRSNAARSSVCRTGERGRRGGRVGGISRTNIKGGGGGGVTRGYRGIILLACGQHQRVFPDMFLVPALLRLPNATSNRNDATEDIQCVVQLREQSRAMWKTLKVKKPGGDEDGLLEESV